MKPAPFEYRAPESLAQVIEILREHGPEAKLLAGGQSLIPLLNFRLARPAIVVDLRRVAELRGIAGTPGGVTIGAMERQRAIEHSGVVAARAPLLVEATQQIGHLPIRTRGTIGGSLAHADPAAEYPVAAVALDAQLVVRGPNGERSVGARDFFIGYLTTALAIDEVLVEIRVPQPPAPCGAAFVELSRRPGDFAIVAVAAVVRLDDRRRIASATIALGGAAPVPLRAEGAETALIGEALDDRSLREAGRLAAAEVEPETDVLATAQYRRALCDVLARRALSVAWDRAIGAAA